MIAYKGFLKGRDKCFLHEVGKTYEFYGTIKIGRTPGFNFYKTGGRALAEYKEYDIKDVMLFKIEVIGREFASSNPFSREYATNKFKIIGLVRREDYHCFDSKYIFDNDGKLIGNKNIIGDHLYQYDNMENIKPYECSDGVKIFYNYDDRNNIIMTTSISEDTCCCSYEYDDNNNLISTIIRRESKSGEKSVLSHMVFKYDSFNNLIKSHDILHRHTMGGSNDFLDGITLKKYNENNQLVYCRYPTGREAWKLYFKDNNRDIIGYMDSKGYHYRIVITG